MHNMQNYAREFITQACRAEVGGPQWPSVCWEMRGASNCSVHKAGSYRSTAIKDADLSDSETPESIAAGSPY